MRLAILLALAGFTACIFAAGAADELPGTRNQGPTGTGNKGKTLREDMECLTEPHLVANVGSPVEGVIAQIYVDRGADVRAGQPVARLNSSVEAATLALKRAQHEYGERKVKRNEDLFKKELISASDRDELVTQMQIAGLEVKQQQEVLNQRTILSPLNGVVVDRFLAPGDHVSQEKIVRIAQINPLNIEVIVPLEHFGAIKVGNVAEIHLEPLVKGTFRAKVTIVDRVVDPGSGTFGVRLELPNPGNKLPAGIRCSVRFEK